jgi:hypothetical protein
MSGSTRLVPWLVLAMLFASCSRESGPPAEAATAPAVPAATAATPDPAAASVAAVAVGSTVLPVTIRFEIPAAPLVGQPSRVTLTVAADQGVERVEISGRSASLLIDEATAKRVLEGLEAGKARQIDVGFTSQAEGLADLELDVSVQTGTGPLQSTFAIPVLTIAAAPAGG